METEFNIAILIGTLLLFAVINGILLWYFLVKREKKDDKEEGKGMMLLQQQLQDLTKTMDSKLSESRKELGESVKTQFSASQKLIQDTSAQMAKHLIEVTKGVTEANEASKQVFTIAEQLHDLEKVLKSQKQRGNLGEAGLNLILGNILPETGYKTQYKFDDGDIVDAVIFTKEGLISVDAKYSLDKYQRMVKENDDERRDIIEKEFKKDLKERIDETAKYIKPREGTLPFAFMFIPAEGIYHDLLTSEVSAGKVNARNLIDYAYVEKNVIIVSPTTFSAYLQSVLYGFRAFKIEESAKEIRKFVESLTKRLEKYDHSFKKVGKTLGTTVNHYDAAQREFRLIDRDILKITGESMDFGTLPLSGPEKEE